MSEHNCDQCDKVYKTRAGLWKHKKAKHEEKPVEVIPISESPEETDSISAPPRSPTDDSPGDTPSPRWMDFDFGSNESTDTIPTTFKSVFQPVPAGHGKMSKAQAQALENQNKGILKMILSFIDLGLTKYGQVVSLDPEFEVKHSENDKELVANAQHRWMEEKGFFLTNYISTGMIAGGLTLHYVAAPMYRIRKKAKRKLFKGRSLLSRLPLIGRLFKRRQPETTEIGQEVEIHEP